MNSYFELSQDNLKRVTVTKGKSFLFPSHFHQKLEVFILTKGNYYVSRNGKPLILSAGDIAVFDSYDIHSYDKFDGDIEGLVIIIPLNTAEKFFKRKGGKKIYNPIISDPQLCNKIYQLGNEFIAPEEVDDTVRNGATELILALLEPKLDLSDKSHNDEITLAQNLLFYINQNFKNDINLKILAREFGYTSEHISRVFNHYLNVSLPEYINSLRLDYIENAISNGSKENITDLLFTAGFKSIQTYYRAKNKRNKS